MKKAARKTARKRSRQKKLTCDVIPVQQNSDSTFYLASLPAKVLWECSKISRAEEDHKKGFQRLLDKRRANKIAAYLNEGGSIPGVIILSTQEEAHLKYNPETNKISFRIDTPSFLVIDGQHRLYGASLCESNPHLPVAIMCDLELEDEVKYFLDINGEQKGVPRTLREELVKFLTAEESADEVRIRLFHDLNQRPNSPLCNKMSPTKSVRGKLSHVPFKKAIDPVLKLPNVKLMTYDQKLNLLINFSSALEANLIANTGTNQKLTNSAFFQAVFASFDVIMDLVYKKCEDYKKSSFEEILEPLLVVEWDEHKGTNKEAIANLSSHITDLLTTSEHISDDLF